MAEGEDEKLDELLTDALHVSAQAKERVMSSLAVALRAEPKAPVSKVKPETFWSKALAAAITLVLTLGLVWMVAPRSAEQPAQAPDAGQKDPTPAGAGDQIESNDDKTPKEADTLSAEQKVQLEQLIKALDSDEFEIRQQAATKIAAFGLSARSFLKARLAAPVKDAPLSGEARLGIKKALAAMDQAERQALIDAALSELQPSVRFVPPDPEIVKQLGAKKISFELVDKSLKEALALLEQESGVPFVIDPAANLVDPPIFSLKVTDMSCDLALQWVMRLVDMEYVVRGKIIVVSTRAEILRSQAHSFKLPVAEGEAPWALEETQTLIKVLECSSSGGYKQGGMGGPTEIPFPISMARAIRPGEILVHTSAERALFEEFLNNFGQKTSPVPQVPEEFDIMEKKLQAKLELKAKLSIEDAIAAIRAASGVFIIIDPKLVVGDLGDTGEVERKGISARDALVEVCRLKSWEVVLKDHAVFFTQLDGRSPRGAPVVFDLRPALKAGLSAERLAGALNTVLREFSAEDGLLLRQRWLASPDAWTAQRLKAMLEGAAKTGRIPAPPPAPWFQQTWKSEEKKFEAPVVVPAGGAVPGGGAGAGTGPVQP